MEKAIKLSTYHRVSDARMASIDEKTKQYIFMYI